MSLTTLRHKAAAGLILAAFLAGPAFADKPEWAGGGKPERAGGPQERGNKHPDKRSEQERDREHRSERAGSSPRASAYFTDRHREAVHRYYGDRFRAGDCPPGLAKKRNGCMPPGQAKKWRIGAPLPRDVMWYDAPGDIVLRLGMPPEGHRFVRVAADILLISGRYRHGGRCHRGSEPPALTATTRGSRAREANRSRAARVHPQPLPSRRPIMRFTRLARALAPALLTRHARSRTRAPADDAATRLYDHSLRRLHADESVRLADRYAGQPVLVVNTASHCGFTRQFRELEAVHQRFKERGLKVAGFPSDDFRQEAADEAETAEVCFQNFGVTFDMYAPIHGDRRQRRIRSSARSRASRRRRNGTSTST